MRTGAIFILCLAAACGESEKRGPVGARIEKKDALRVPPFSFLERQGVPVGRDTLKGKVWLASLIFTRCQTSCIPMCGEMVELQDEFADAPDFRLVSTTVDPAYDTRAVLEEFAQGYGADPERWLFLTGKRKDIRKFAHEGLKIQWKDEDPLIHSTYFVLVDRDGTIRDYFNQTDKEEMQRMRSVIREVLAEKTP